MIIFRIVALLLITAAFPGGINAASFDCAKAKSRAEILICSDPELATLDDDLANIYSRAKSLAPSPAEFKEQGAREWKRRETTCFDKPCLLAWYSERREQLLRIINDHTSKPQPSPPSPAKDPAVITPDQKNDGGQKNAPPASHNREIYQVKGTGYYGCKDKENFKKLRDMLMRGDDAIFLKEKAIGVKKGECVMLNKGEQVTLEEGTSISTVIRIKKESDPSSYWTTPKAIQP